MQKGPKKAENCTKKSKTVVLNVGFEFRQGKCVSGHRMQDHLDIWGNDLCEVGGVSSKTTRSKAVVTT